MAGNSSYILRLSGPDLHGPTVRISSSFEIRFVQKYSFSYFDLYYADFKRGNGFEWTNGGHLFFMEWAENETREYNCTYVDTHGLWHTGECDRRLPFLCEHSSGKYLPNCFYLRVCVVYGMYRKHASRWCVLLFQNLGHDADYCLGCDIQYIQTKITVQDMPKIVI